MSWNAHLGDGMWNYTHNTNGMIEWVLGDAVATTKQPWWSRLGGDDSLGHGAWWDLLDGKTGTDSLPLLNGIIEGLRSQPERFRAMNPPNGWGDYDQLVDILTEMLRAAEELPNETWGVNG